MKKIILILIILLVSLSLVNSALAQSIITVHGQPRKTDNQIDMISGIEVFDEHGTKIEVEEVINNDEGYFEVRGLKAPTGETDPKTIWVMGSCFTHTFAISKKADQFMIVDAHDPDRTIMNTLSSNIDLGTLKEDKSNLVWVNSNTPITFLAEDMNGNEVALNTGFKKRTGMSNSFKPRTSYKITLKSNKGKRWEKIITTGDYCESTRIIKRGDYFVVENFPNNILPQIGFWRKIKLWFRGLF